MRRNKLWLGLAAGGILLVGLITGALISGGLPAWAANAFSGQGTSAPTASTPGSYCQVYLQALAGELHISPAALAQANQAALTTTIEQAFKDGKISQAEEQKLLNQVKSASTHPCAFARFGRWPRGVDAARPRLQAAQTAIETAVASKLGLSVATVRSDLRSGQSIAQIAQNQHVALDGSNGLNAAYLAAVQQQLNQAVTDKLITQAQASRLYQMAQQGVAAGRYFLLSGFSGARGPRGHSANPQQPQPPAIQN